MELSDYDINYRIERYTLKNRMELSFFVEVVRRKDIEDIYTPRHFNFQKNDTAFIALGDKNDILGFIHARDCRFGGCQGKTYIPNNDEVVRLLDLYVDRYYRHLGIATSLIQVLKQDYAKKGLDKIIAVPTPELHKSQFYPKRGLIEEEIFKTLSV